MRSHLFIPDTQVRKGVPLEHIDWIGQYAVDKRPDVIVVAGDWWDMPSLTSHEHPGSLALEGARYEDDVQAGNEAFDRLCKPIEDEIARIKRRRIKHWNPEFVFLMGNHEDRIRRAQNADPKYAATIGDHHLNASRHGFKVYPFLQVATVDGIWYSHYFARPLSGRPFSGALETRLKNVGNSFTQGHEQIFGYANRHLANGKVQHGLVAGACYMHVEDYKGRQGNYHWRGIVMKHEVRDGNYDVMPVSLDFLARKYEGLGLRRFLQLKHPKVPVDLVAP